MFIAGVVVGSSLLPTFPQDAHPFESQRPEDGPVPFAFGFHLLVIRPGPVAVDHRLARPLHKALPQEPWSLPAPVRPQGAAAFLPHRGQARILLQAVGVGITVTV